MIGRLLGWIVGPLGAALGAVLALVGAYVAGNRNARQKAKTDALKGYKETRERIDNAESVDSPADAADWLRKRGKR